LGWGLYSSTPPGSIEPEAIPRPQHRKTIRREVVAKPSAAIRTAVIQAYTRPTRGRTEGQTDEGRNRLKDKRDEERRI
jgi:hypothetical protein